jgi:CDP-paratose 2-epimerase
MARSQLEHDVLRAMRLDGERPVLITGGAGFIGTNLAHCLLAAGQPVVVYDNLARAGTDENLRWLQGQHDDHLEVVVADIRDRARLRPVVDRVGRVFHLAAQVAVTTSLIDPAHDFEVNAGGTLALLEAIRESPLQPPLLYTSTSKVYGTLRGVRLGRFEGRYAPLDAGLRGQGISEDHPLDFHSPHGCSKGAADQYVLDYARVFGLRAVVFRMSCIYGPFQRGHGDQGWVAHFLRQALAGRPITVCGDGRQVRDLLFVDDLCAAMWTAQLEIDRLSGRAFNIGGGPANAVSVLELLALSERLIGRRAAAQMAEWRPTDQRYYVSDVSAFTRACSWRPRIGVDEGVGRLLRSLPPGVGLRPGTRHPGGQAPVEGAPDGTPALRYL